jgi:hypothetical protein
MRPGIAAHTLKRAPQLFALATILTRRWDARWLAVLDDLRQVHRHVAVDVKDFPVHDQTTEATDETLFDGRLFELLAGIENFCKI